MSLFNSPFALVATASLAVQIVVLFLLVYGFWLRKKNMISRHAAVMTAAVALHLTMIFGIMVPGLVLAIVPEFVVLHVFGLTSVITLIHVPFGIAAVSLGVWLVASWRFKDLKRCFRKKRIMLATMTLWLISLSFGIILYGILYWAVLMG